MCVLDILLREINVPSLDIFACLEKVYIVTVNNRHSCQAEPKAKIIQFSFWIIWQEKNTFTQIIPKMKELWKLLGIPLFYLF